MSGDAAASELAVRLVPRLRLVSYAFEKTYGSEAAGVWQAPGALVLLGGRPDGPALVVPVRWSAAVAGAPRDDRALVIGSLNRPAEPVRLDPEVPDGGPLPGWAVPARAVAEALREAGHPGGGATLMLNADVPETAGVASLEAQRCATNANPGSGSRRKVSRCRSSRSVSSVQRRCMAWSACWTATVGSLGAIDSSARRVS